MFENVKTQQSQYLWKTLEDISGEERKEIMRIQREIVKLPQSTRFIDQNQSLFTRLRRLRVFEIVYLAYQNTGGSFSGHVFLNPDNLKELAATTWTGTTYLNPDSSLIEIYSLDSNWRNNNPWRVNDILKDEEWNKFCEEHFDEANFLDEENLESVGIDLDTRLLDYLVWTILEKERRG